MSSVSAARLTVKDGVSAIAERSGVGTMAKLDNDRKDEACGLLWSAIGGMVSIEPGAELGEHVCSETGTVEDGVGAIAKRDGVDAMAKLGDGMCEA